MWTRHKVKVNHAYKGELTEEDIGPSWPTSPRSWAIDPACPRRRGANDSTATDPTDPPATRARCPGRVVSGAGPRCLARGAVRCMKGSAGERPAQASPYATGRRSP